MASLFGTAATAAATANNSLGDISKDVPLVSPPEDSISDLAFSPESQHLAVSSWDKKVRIYEVNNQGNSEGKAMFEHEAPVLSVHWSRGDMLRLRGGEKARDETRGWERMDEEG